MAGFAALAVGVSVLGGDLLNPAASTADGDYAGETVTMMIPLAEGGGTDTWARFVGSALTEAVPGSPGLAPENDDGGEGILGTNHFMTSAKPDGTEVLVSTASTVVPYLLDVPAVKYDFSELRPILANGTGAVVYARSKAGVAGVEDLIDRDEPLIFGGIAATGLDLTTLLAFDLLSADIDSTFGFEGRGPVNLALQRGEVDIDYQTTSAYGPAVEPMVKDGTAVPLFSLGQVDGRGRDRARPQLPRHPHGRRGLRGVVRRAARPRAARHLPGDPGAHLHLPEGPVGPGGHPGRGARPPALHRGGPGSDPAFQKSAAEVLGGYPIDASADLEQRIGEAYQVDDDVRANVLELLESTYNITIE